MSKRRVLFVSQEITPYLPENQLSDIGRNLPQGIQESGKEIRTFMPRFGCINERRHQLHEVIRLSGMNLVVNDFDHPLIIKVASIQAARMQVYFIDNEEYFQRKALFENSDDETFEDNDERAIFFAKGVLETVKKLGWSPDVIHCHGWMTATLPLYLKTHYKDDPIFSDTQVVYSVYDSQPKGSLSARFREKVLFDGLEPDRVELLSDPSYNNVHRLAVQNADGVVLVPGDIDDSIRTFAEEHDKLILDHPEENYVPAYDAFYDRILEERSVLAN